MKAGILMVGTALLGAVLASPAQAKLAYVKKAQDAGHKPLVANCQSCHKAKLPTKKEFAMNDALGGFLTMKMKETGAKEMDIKWLKDYKPKK